MAIEYVKKPYTSEQVEGILNPLVKKWFFSRFKTFSLPQLYGVMEIHSRNNVLVSAPTGATKTLTAFLSILNELIENSEKGILEDKVYAIYVSPLRALSNDIEFNLNQPLKQMEEIAGKKLGIRVAVRTGDTETKDRTKMLKTPPHILITTPESLDIMLTSPKFRDHLKNVDWFIVDEIHALAENKRGVDLSIAMERLSFITPHTARIGLSATVAPIEEIAKFLVGYKDGKENSCKIIDVQFLKEMDLRVLSPVEDLINTGHTEMHKKMYELMDKLIQEHKTTLIFTNTRAATERVVDHLTDRFPKNYSENIGAHHGSLSKESRHKIEEKLRKGELKVIVSSTSLELGIDIGYIDLVICLGSPKSVARFLQRAGRSGHQLHNKVKARIIVLDRDDLIECGVLLKSAIEKKIDRIHIPRNCLDVLAQQIYGMAIEQKWNINELFKTIKQSYCYKDLERKEFMDVIDYLTGKYISLEDRHIYAKIWYDEETKELGKKGKMSRVIYMTNVGTIPDETKIKVKVGTETVGTIDEAFLEKLRRGDVFVLGGNKYQFLYAKGTVAFVTSSVVRPPTIPTWFSEMLPLSYDLAIEIGKFRKLLGEKFCYCKTKEEIIEFINKYLYVDKNAAESIYNYFSEQYEYAQIPSNSRIIIEHYKDERAFYAIFHALYGRRVNDCLSRAVAFAVSRSLHKDVEIGINDNGFYVASDRKINIMSAFKLIKSEEIEKVMDMAIDRTEVLTRRFRHCATRSLMILRNYKGRTKRVGRQQVASTILINSVRRIGNDFSILKEARREVLEDLMDIKNTKEVLEGIEKKNIKIEEIKTQVPSPFAFNLIVQGFTDIFKIEDKVEFLKRMHNNVLAKIELKKARSKKE